MTNSTKNRTSLIVEGGAMRGIFTAGVLDCFIRNNFYPFDTCFGVSAGAPNVSLYLAGLYKHSYKIFTKYMCTKGFKSWRRFALGGNLLDIDWLWNELTSNENFNIKKIFSRHSKLVIVTANAKTGKAIYFEPDQSNLIKVLKAASTVPIVHRRIPLINGIPLMDGGVGDPLPVNEAYRRGANKIMVIRTRKYDYQVTDRMDRAMSAIYLRNKPLLRAAIANKAVLYRAAIKYLRNPPPGVEFIEINPPNSFQTARLTKDISVLNKDYELGYQMGEIAMKKWKNSVVTEQASVAN